MVPDSNKMFKPSWKPYKDAGRYKEVKQGKVPFIFFLSWKELFYIFNKDVSFQAIAWIQAFMKPKFPQFYLFLTRFGGF